MPLALCLSLFGRLDGPFLVPAKTASAAARGRGQGRPPGRRAGRASLDGDEHGRTLAVVGETARTARAGRATVSASVLAVLLILAGAATADASERWREHPQVRVAIAEAARLSGLPEGWIEAVAVVESAGQPRAVSVKGAMGLMQLMPGTWRDLRGELGLGVDPFSPRDNLVAGAIYLRRMFDRFGRDGFLAAYNAGPGRYQAYVDGARGLPVETADYVRRVEARIGPVRGEAPDQGAQRERDWRQAELFVGPSRDPDPARVGSLFVGARAEDRP